MEPEKFESYLTAEELENYKKNLIARDCPLSYERFVKQSTEDVVVGGAFPWMDTPEGADYWIEINRRVKSDMPITLPVKEEVMFDIPKGVDYMQFFTAEQWGELTAIAMETLGIKGYQDWMNSHHVSIGSFIYSAIPTKKQSRFVQNIRIADSSTYRESRGYKIVPGEFMTKDSATTDHDHVISVKRPDATHTWSEEFMMEMTAKVYEQIQKLL